MSSILDPFDDFPASYENARVIGCFRAFCVRVVDGDTYDFILDLGVTIRVKLRVRLRGFDTAEYFHPSNNIELAHAMEAIEFVTPLIFMQPCLVRTYRTKSGSDVTTVGRYVADVYYQEEPSQFRDIKYPMHEAKLEKREEY